LKQTNREEQITTEQNRTINSNNSLQAKYDNTRTAQ
jgi:hypothetical protein